MAGDGAALAARLTPTAMPVAGAVGLALAPPPLPRLIGEVAEAASEVAAEGDFGAGE